MKYQSKNILQNSIYVSLALTMTLGSELLLAAEVCDVDGNNVINQNDIDLIFQVKNTKAKIPFDPRDIDRSGVIDTNDARLCVCKLPTTDACSVPLNQTPVADAGADQDLAQVVFGAINLDGGLSSDPDKDSLSYQWSFQQRPTGSQVALLGDNTVAPNFIPDLFGTYVLALIVTDGFGEKSNADLITLTLSNPSSLEANADVNTTQAGGATITGNLLSNDVVANRQVTLAPLLSNVSTPKGGVFSLQNNRGDYSYTPPQFLDVAIEEVLTYSLTGLDGKQSSSTLTIKVTPNAPLQAVADSNVAQAGRGSATGNLLGNDIVGDRKISLTPLWTNYPTPKGGVFSLQDNGIYTYIPPQSVDTTIEEVLSYTITGLDGKKSVSTLTITTSPNLPLKAQADTNTVQAGGVTVTGDLLSNDDFKNRDISISPLLMNFSTPIGGVFSLENNGGYSYTSPQFIDALTSESLTYTITGVDGRQSSSTLTITINPLAPLKAVTDANTVQAGGAAITGDVLGNDVLDNRTVNLSPLLADFPTPKGGKFSLQNNGHYTYLPPQDIGGVIEESVTYTITGLDGKQSSAILTITVNPNNRLPLARPDSSKVVANGSAISGNVLSNDDRGNQPTQVISALTNVDTPLGGIFSLQGDGRYTYTPPKNVEGIGVTQEQFNYTIADIDGETSTSILSIVINPENRQAIAQPDSANATAGGKTITGNVLKNDDLGNQPIKFLGANSIAETSIGGAFTLSTNGDYSYVPPQQITGVTSEKFNYSIASLDDKVVSASTLTIRVSPESLTPLANPDSRNVTAGGGVITGNVLTNDTQGNAPVSISLVDSNADNVGVLDLQADGRYSYTPPATVSGVVTDIFTYTITDQDGETSTSTLTVQVSMENLTPQANPDSSNATAGGGVITGNVLMNDIQGNGNASALHTASNADNVGSLDLQADGRYSYTPPATVSGVVTDIFTYTITDQDGETSTSTLTIQVSKQNLVPQANPDSGNATAGGSVVNGNVLTNDTQGNAPVSISLANANADNVGSLDLQADGRYSYTPPATVSGVVTDIFTYTITDQDGETSTSTLTVKVSMENLVPQANPDSGNATAGRDVITGNVLTNDIQGNGPVSISLANANTDNVGSLDLQADGRYSYTPPTIILEAVEDVFMYTITDQDGEASTSTLTIQVGIQNLKPQANPDKNKATAGGKVVKGNVLSNDIEGNAPASVTLNFPNSLHAGTIDLKSNGSYSYTPPATGSKTVDDIFVYTLTDKDGETSVSNLTISVAVKNIKPVARPDTDSVVEGGLAIGNVLDNDILGNAPVEITLLSGDFLVLGEDGSYKYSPLSEVTHDTPFVYTYRITDKDGETSESTLTIMVKPRR